MELTKTENVESAESIFRPALLLMSGKAAAFVITFFIPVILVRVLSVAEFGTYKLIFVIITMLYGIGQIGMAECLFYFLPTFPQHAGRFIANSLMMLSAAGVLCFVGLITLSGRIASSLNNPSLVRYIAFAAAYLTLMLAACSLETVMVARKRYKFATYCFVASDVTRGLLLVIPAIIFRSVMALMVGGVLFCALRVISLVIYVRREFRGELRIDTTQLRRQLGYALPFSLAVVVDTLQANYHQLAVSHFFDAATLAIYSVGCLQIPLVDFMATPASNVMMVRMGEELREGRIARVLSIWHDTTRKLALVFFPLVGLVVVNAHNLITFLFTQRYAASVPIFMVWSLSILFGVMQTDGVLRVFAKTRFLFLMNVTRLIVIVALMHWFLATFHLVGAVLVTLLGILVARVTSLIQIQRLLNCGFQRVLPWKELGGLSLIAMAAAIPAALCNQLQLAPLYLLPICGTVYMAVYAGGLMVSGALNEGEKRAVTGFVGRCMRVRIAQ